MVVGAAPICMECKHFDFEGKREGLTCDAFPNGIPEAIIFGDADHHQPYKGDHGIQFEAKEGEQA